MCMHMVVVDTHVVRTGAGSAEGKDDFYVI
jgi:hypothetical protein